MNVYPCSEGLTSTARYNPDNQHPHLYNRDILTSHKTVPFVAFLKNDEVGREYSTQMQYTILVGKTDCAEFVGLDRVITLK